MGADLLILFVTALGFWWLSGRLIDDVLDQLETSAWVRAHERVGRRAEGEDEAA